MLSRLLIQLLCFTVLSTACLAAQPVAVDPRLGRGHPGIGVGGGDDHPLREIGIHLIQCHSGILRPLPSA
jgi:hypothetical protein